MMRNNGTTELMHLFTLGCLIGGGKVKDDELC